ncbi:hypothetical protein [Macrococcus animalis]|uniref:hypothetical protein n=1 Tax=Macrococcus animalis TaxID=3395467 RepID=UPI0039BE2D94
MYTPNQVREILKEYKNMTTFLESSLLLDDSTSIAQYGIEATLPRAQGSNGDKVASIVLKRTSGSKLEYQFANKVKFIDEHEYLITGILNQYIMELLKRGYTQTQIALITNNHKSTISDKVTHIVEVLSNASSDKSDKKDKFSL